MRGRCARGIQGKEVAPVDPPHDERAPEELLHHRHHQHQAEEAQQHERGIEVAVRPQRHEAAAGRAITASPSRA